MPQIGSYPLAQRLSTDYRLGVTAAGAIRRHPGPVLDGTEKNVREFGAVGNGSTDDSGAIQEAIDYASTPYSASGRGRILFPPGIYQVASTSTFHSSAGILGISFIGVPGAKIRGDFAGALLEREVNSPLGGIYRAEGLQFENNHAQGKCLVLHSCVAAKVVNCQFNGPGAGSTVSAIETYNSQSAVIDASSIIGFGIGVMGGNATTVRDTDISGCGHGIRHQNVGLVVQGGRYEVNTVAIAVGFDEDNEGFQAAGVDISGLSMEANQTAILFGAVGAAKISALSIQGGVPMAYGIRLGSVQDMVMQGIIVGGPEMTGAGIEILGATRLKIQGVSSIPGAGTAWAIAEGLSSFSLEEHNAALTVAQLPTAAPVGTVLGVTNATATTVGSTVAGGGANSVGTARSAGVWRII
jgi:hypothetical protein